MYYGELFDCVYSAVGKCTKGKCLGETCNVRLAHNACFQNIYGYIKRWEESEILYRVYIRKEDVEGKNFNLCTYAETKKILRNLQKVVPFYYSFSTDNYTDSTYSRNTVPYTVLNVSLKGNSAQHIFITSMLRCFFEWPFNVAAKEACELQTANINGRDFSKVNWLNLYFTIAAQLGSYSLHGIVSFNAQPKNRSYAELKRLLETSKSKEVHKLITKSGNHFSKNISKMLVYSEDEYLRDKKIRIHNYVAAYKDKESWKK